MAVYFDSTIPTLPDGTVGMTPPEPDNASNVPQAATCLVCSVAVWNTAAMRKKHADWHDLIAVTAVGAFGTATNPASMPLSSTTDVIVPLSREMPSTDYAAAAEIVSGTGTTLAGARVQGIVARAKTTVTVRVQNTGLAALAANAFTVAVLARGPLPTT